jgi:hypothetical protein
MKLDWDACNDMFFRTNSPAGWIYFKGCRSRHARFWKHRSLERYIMNWATEKVEFDEALIQREGEKARIVARIRRRSCDTCGLAKEKSGNKCEKKISRHKGPTFRVTCNF